MATALWSIINASDPDGQALRAEERTRRVSSVARQELLDALRQHAHRNGAPPLHPDAARLLHWLALTTGAQHALELGTGNGYATLWLADAMAQNGGQLISVDRDAVRQEVARDYLARAGLLDVVTLRCDDAVAAVETLDSPVDLALIDLGDKEAYLPSLRALLPRLRPHAVIMADNVRSHAQELAAFLDWIRAEPRFALTELPFGPGQALLCWLPDRAGTQ